MPKPLSETEQNHLFSIDPFLLGIDNAYLSREAQHRGYIASAQFPDFLKREDKGKLRNVLEEHYAFRRDLKNRGLL